MSRKLILEELSVLSALLFADGLYSPNLRIPLSWHRRTARLSNPIVNALRIELKILNMII